ncbi:unnamed protein product [Candida verbasci]|uniref:Uncharacterized protein n=1 Tax=Candida verbasci TaxID=1227364 RepID=A0A9W4TWW2_9ASCO|nr:unnamed protein product [Candida verbasci]
MNYQDAYIQDKKRKLSQEMDSDLMEEKLTALNVEQKEDINMLMNEAIATVVATSPLTVDELERRNRALIMIEEFLKSENSELKKSLNQMQKENKVLKDVLKNDCQVNYKYINKSYE